MAARFEMNDNGQYIVRTLGGHDWEEIGRGHDYPGSMMKCLKCAETRFFSSVGIVLDPLSYAVPGCEGGNSVKCDSVGDEHIARTLTS